MNKLEGKQLTEAFHMNCDKCRHLVLTLETTCSSDYFDHFMKPVTISWALSTTSQTRTSR